MRAVSAVALATLVLTVTGCSDAATEEGKLASIRGKDFGTTGALYPEHPWTVVYSWDCAKQRAAGRNVLEKVRVAVVHADDGAEVEKDAHVDRTGNKGQGQLQYKRPGAYVVSITTECDFQLRVEEDKA